MTELAPDLKVAHFADAGLLERLVAGEEESKVEQSVQDKVRDLSEHANLVVCTCSSSGRLAESLMEQGVNVQRIDRAMGDRAVTHDRVLLLAALSTTIEPSLALLETSEGNCIRQLETFVVEGAWERFLDQDYQGYYDKIKAVIERKARDYDVIVLAQASMSGAASLVDVDIPVLSSPRLGVKRAIETLRIFHANN